MNIVCVRPLIVGAMGPTTLKTKMINNVRPAEIEMKRKTSSGLVDEKRENKTDRNDKPLSEYRC